MNCIVVVQMSSDVYFWALVFDSKFIATSRLIGNREEIVREANAVGEYLSIPIEIKERTKP